MPVDWPLAASAADRPVASLRLGAGRDRLATVRADFFLDERDRLTDEERALMSAMLRGLVEDVTDEVMTRLPALTAARTEGTRREVYDRLRQSGLLVRDGVLSLLLRRADEQQLGGRSTDRSDQWLASLVGDADAAVAEAAMTLTIARGRRRDRFGRLGIEFDDLSAEDAVALAYGIAAVLRDTVPDDEEAALADAARRILAKHDEGRRLEAAVTGLARALDATGRSGDETIVAAASAGDAALLSGLLARRAGIEAQDAWDFFANGRPMLLTRLASCQRSTAAQIIAGFDPLLGIGDPDQAIEQFDQLAEEQVERCRRWMRLDPQYRAARDSLESLNG